MRVKRWVCLALFVMPGLAVAGKPEQGELAAIRGRIDSYVSAFNGHKAEALAGHWSEQAEYIHPLTEARIHGRDAICKAFTELFKAEPKLRLSVSNHSLRLVDENVAIEDATATVVSPDAPPEQAGYTAVHVKKNGQWYRASVREVVLAPQPTPSEALKELAWMIGDWKGNDPKTPLRMRCQWIGGGHFLSRSFALGGLEGTQIIGWDPSFAQIRSWTFDSEGGFSEGVWTRRHDNWVVKATAVMPDGTTGAEQRIVTPDGPNRFTWRSVGRQVDGQILPGTDEVLVVRAGER
jgi:uncharacterized protein (TIGR02246 family)